MLGFLRSLLGRRYDAPETPDDSPCDSCEQLEVRQRLHAVANRLNVLKSEASLYEREEPDDDTPRDRH